VTERKKVAVLLNPNAGNYNQHELRRSIAQVLWGYDVKFLLSKSKEHLAKLCAELDRSRFVAAIVAGGDGSVSAALPGLIESGVPLYPLPFGTANDLSAELGIVRSFEQIPVLFERNTTKLIDVAFVNDIPFVTVGGIGIGSELLTEFNERRVASNVFFRVSRSIGPLVYTLLSIKTILRPRDVLRVLRVESDDFLGTIETPILLACNQKRFGKTLEVAPDALNNDGLIDILMLTRTARINTMKALDLVRKGEDPEGCVRFQTRRLCIEDAYGASLRFFGDGDILCEAKKLCIEMKPKSLKVFYDNKGEFAKSPKKERL
jgi:diacylglycerol kinase family enzyme